jgi:O-antigen/teichoic acid export membrane protein
MAKSSFLKHALIYGSGNLLVYAAGFILLPLYVRCLSEGEFGTLDFLNRMGEVVLLCLLFKGLRQALFSFHNQARDETEKRAVIGSALFFTLLFLGVGGGIAALMAEPMCGWFRLGDPGVLRLAILAVFLESFTVLLLALAQARVESLLFSLVSIGQFLVRVVLCIVFVTVYHWGVAGVLIASAISSGVFAAWLLLREVRRGGLRVDREQMRSMYWFALPFIPAGFAFFLLNSGDRFFLRYHVTDEQLGVYALGYKLALVVKLFSRRPLYQVWSAQMYEAAREPDAPTMFGKVFTRILAVYVGVGLALCLVAEEVVSAFTGGGYVGAAAMIPPIVLAYFFLTATDLMESGFYIKRKTGQKTVVMMFATAVTLALYALLIPPFQNMGAALATVGGFIFYAALTGIVGQRFFVVHYEWRRVTLLLVWAVLLWLAGLMLPADLWLLPVKAALWSVWPVLVWLTVLSNEEKDWLRDLFARVRPRRVSLPMFRARKVNTAPLEATRNA